MLGTLFPTTLFAARKVNGCEQSDQILSYLICPRSECFTIHDYTTCSIRQGGCKCSKTQFPNHPMLRFRQPSDSPLLKSVYLSSGIHIYYPLKIYCYYPLKRFIEKLLIRPKIQDMFHWINRETSSNLIDVYDGDIWKEFMNPDDPKTLQTIALMLNMDWFRTSNLLSWCFILCCNEFSTRVLF